MLEHINAFCRRKFQEYAMSVLRQIVQEQKLEMENLRVDVKMSTEIGMKELERNVTVNVLRGVEQALTNTKMNDFAFKKYRNIHRGKRVVICGAGPSLTDYKPIKDTINIALNRAFLFDKVKFDYIFVQDYRGVDMIKEELKQYEGNNCIKFFGTQNGSFDDEIPESYAVECGAVRYATDGYIWLYEGKCKFAYELNSKSVGNFSTIALPAFQFALWTNPEEIYIVGCDSTPNGHFAGEETDIQNSLATEEQYNKVIMEWKNIAAYANLYYPNTKIYSVNPVALKGIFADIFM